MVSIFSGPLGTTLVTTYTNLGTRWYHFRYSFRYHLCTFLLPLYNLGTLLGTSLGTSVVTILVTILGNTLGTTVSSTIGTFLNAASSTILGTTNIPFQVLLKCGFEYQ